MTGVSQNRGGRMAARRHVGGAREGVSRVGANWVRKRAGKGGRQEPGTRVHTEGYTKGHVRPETVSSILMSIGADGAGAGSTSTSTTSFSTLLLDQQTNMAVLSNMAHQVPSILPRWQQRRTPSSCASSYHLPALVPFRLRPTRSPAKHAHNSHAPSMS